MTPPSPHPGSQEAPGSAPFGGERSGEGQSGVGHGEAVIFDLEFTAWEGSKTRQWSDPGEYKEIIQIGALRVDAATGAERDSFDRLVKPLVNPVLSDFIEGLTGIRNEDIAANGTFFDEAHSAFLEFTGDRPLFCYGWDEVVIAENVHLYGLERRFGPVLTTNLHRFFARCGLPVRTINSGALAGRLGISLEGGQEHNGVFDCRSLAAAAGHFIRQGHRSPFLSPEPSFGPAAFPADVPD